MNNVNQKYKSVEKIAMNDITKYNRNCHKNKPPTFFAENLITANQLFTKETRRLNRKLGLNRLNYQGNTNQRKSMLSQQ